MYWLKISRISSLNCLYGYIMTGVAFSYPEPPVVPRNILFSYDSLNNLQCGSVISRISKQPTDSLKHIILLDVYLQPFRLSSVVSTASNMGRRGTLWWFCVHRLTKITNQLVHSLLEPLTDSSSNNNVYIHGIKDKVHYISLNRAVNR